MSNLQMSTTHKINITDLNDKLNGQQEYMPYKLNINNSVDTFLKIRETLTRVGRLQESKNGGKASIFQVCHIIQDSLTNEYYLVHFKHLYMLLTPENETVMNEQDYNQMTYIASLLEKWNFCKIDESLEEVNQRCNVSIIPFAKKKDVNLRKKFNYKKHSI